MKEAITKLMIATMMVDGEMSLSEQKTIKTVLGVMDIDDSKYQDFLEQTKFFKDVEDYIDWCGSAINRIAEQDDTGWKAISIVSMALVAMADTKIDPSESRLIAAVSEMLNVNIDSLNSTKSA
jgi:uncharacterized tellurite resistance protein B-like protein